MKKRRKLFLIKGKKGIESEMSIWWILAIIGMAIILLLVFDVSEAWGSAAGYMKNLLRFGK